MEEHEPLETNEMIAGIASGNADAQESLYRQYAHRLAIEARKYLKGVTNVDSGSDIVQSVLARFMICAQEGRFPRLESRGALEAVLRTMTIRHAINKRKWSTRAMRCPRQTVSDDDLIIGDIEFRNYFGEVGVELGRQCIIQGKPVDDVAHALSLDTSETHSRLAAIRHWLDNHRTVRLNHVAIEDQGLVADAQAVTKALEAMSAPELAAVLQESLAMLDPTERDVVEKYLLEGHTKKEVSQLLKISVPTVRHRLENAYRRWRGTLS